MANNGRSDSDKEKVFASVVRLEAQLATSWERFQEARDLKGMIAGLEEMRGQITHEVALLRKIVMKQGGVV